MEGVFDRIRKNISRVMIGKEEVIELLLAALAAGGHVLLEDVPGTGKTVLAKALAKSMDFRFGRVQFTPDLLPSDVTGLSYYHQEGRADQKAGGTVFCHCHRESCGDAWLFPVARGPAGPLFNEAFDGRLERGGGAYTH